MSDFTSLADHFLIAMPTLQDPFFGQSLVYLFEHNPEGAMGLVINQPVELSLADVLSQLRPEQEPPAHTSDIPIYAGGPVQTERGFVMHPPGSSYQSTVDLGALSITNSKDILTAIAQSKGPEQFLIALGYAGWGAGQLEEELKSNTWLSCPASHTIIFSTPPEERRSAAARSLGIQLSRLSHLAGHS